MAKGHKTKQAALTAARKALGDSAVEGKDFTLTNTGAGWTHAEVPAANEGAKNARAAKPKASIAQAVKAMDKKHGDLAPERKAKAPGKPKRSAAERARNPDSGKHESIARQPTPAPEGSSKTAQLVEMMSRSGGATSKQMEEVTGWASHSVRGLIGTLKKKGTPIESVKAKGEPVVYKIATTAPAEPVGDVI